VVDEVGVVTADLGSATWTVTCVEPDPSSIPDRAAIVRDGIAAQVPGCIHTDLMAAGLLDDPYVGVNEAEQTWVGEQTWRYSTVIEMAADAPELTRDHVDLVFDGLDTVAVVTLNGLEVARTFNQHRSYRFAVKGMLREGANTLEVTFLPALAYARQQEAEGVGPRVHTELHPYNAIRKMACNFGWDWGPRLITCGIWKGVRLESWNHARIAGAAVLGDLAADGTGKLTVRLWLEGELRFAGVTVRVKGEGATAEAGVIAEAETVIELAVPGVAPWWPHSMGDQPLYDVEIHFHNDERTLDLLTRRVGFRSVTLDTTPDADGGGARFALAVNGHELWVRGANWIPDDCFPSRVDADRYAERVRQSVEANIDLLRVWGGGLYESDDFYDACDAQGVLVWQDFTLACAAYAEEEPLRTEFEAEARDNVLRLAHHPSLAIWNGGNENLWGFDQWGWQAALKGATWGAGYYYDLFPSIVEELDGTRPYWAGSPGSGNLGIHANNANYGTVHVWDVWNTDDYTHYSQYSPRFVAEFGFQGPATWATLRRTVEKGEQSPASATMLAHQKANGGNDKLTRGLIEHLPVPGTDAADFDNWLYLTQLNQARAVRYGIEWWRSMRGRTMGSIVWQINDCWPVTSWAALDLGTDADGRPVARRKPLWYALRSVYADRLLTIQPDGAQGWQVVAVNDGTEPWATTVRCTARTLDGTVAADVDVTVDVPARSTIATTLPIAVRQGQRIVLVAEAEGAERCVRPLAEDIDLGLPVADFTTSVIRDGERTTVRVHAQSFCRSLALFADRAAENLHTTDMLVDLFGGENHDFVIDGDLSSVSDDDLVACIRAVNDERMSALFQGLPHQPEPGRTH
jgi:beta-mannosidase